MGGSWGLNLAAIIRAMGEIVGILNRGALKGQKTNGHPVFTEWPRGSAKEE